MSSEFLQVVAVDPPGDATASAITEALRKALETGPPIAPLPPDPVEAEQVRTMLRPDLPVTEPDAAAVVATSGSTGQPKGVVLSRSAITASAHATHDRLGGPGRWLLALPVHYVAGLMVVARAAIADTPLLDVGSDLRGVPDAVERPDGQRCYLSMVPTQLRRALSDPTLIAALTRVDAVLLGGGPAAAELLASARAAGITVVTTYGMSETCGGCVYGGIPLSGAQVSLTPEPDDQQRILLSGPMLFSGYRLRPDLTARTLVNDSFRTNDRGELTVGRLRVLGRFDDVMISGGVKIDLAAVEAAARDWPSLDGGEMVMIGVPDTDWGTKLVAYAETGTPRATLGLDDLRAYLDDRVARHQQPKELIILSRLPRTAGGKVDRRRLVAGHSSGPAGADSAQPASAGSDNNPGLPPKDLA